MPDATTPETVATETPAPAPNLGRVLDGLDFSGLNKPKEEEKAEEKGKKDEKPAEAEGKDAAAEADDEGEAQDAAEGQADAEAVGEEAGGAQDDAGTEVVDGSTNVANPAAAAAEAATPPATPPAKPAAPAAPAQPAAEQPTELQQRQARLKAIKGEIAALLLRVDAPDYDAYGEGGKLLKLQVEADDHREFIADQRVQAAEERAQRVEQQAAADRQWTDWAKANPEIGVDKGQQLWQEELNRTLAENPDLADTPKAIQRMALRSWEHRVATLKGKARADAVDAKDAARKPVANNPAAKQQAAGKGNSPGTLLPRGTAGRNVGQAPEDDYAKLRSAIAPKVRNFLT